MPFKPKLTLPHISTPWKIGSAALIWLVLISCLHLSMNGNFSKRIIIKMGYMPVITNLASPLLDYASRDGDGVRFEAVKFASFAEMSEALRNDQIQVAFIIAPLAIVLRQQGEDVKIVYIGNRHESTLVVRKDLNVNKLSDLTGKTLAVPMRYSGHNLSIRQMMDQAGITGQINVVEMNPPDMASALVAGSLDAYYVGEPFAAQTIKSGHAKVLYYVEEVWDKFICNLVLVKGSFIRNRPEIVKTLVQGAARSGVWAKEHPEKAAQIASQYWNQTVELVQYALTQPENRIRYDLFVPQMEEMQKMADLMFKFGLIKNTAIDGLIEDKFAKTADLTYVTDTGNILYPPETKN